MLRSGGRLGGRSAVHVALARLCTISLYVLATAAAAGAGDGIRFAYEVTIANRLRGTEELTALWKAHGLWLGEPRNIYERRGNYLVVMAAATADALKVDARVERVSVLSRDVASTRSGGGDGGAVLADVDPRISQWCKRHPPGVAPCAAAAPAEQTVALQVIANVYFDPSADSASEIASGLRAARAAPGVASDPCGVQMTVSVRKGERLFSARVAERQMCRAVDVLRTTKGVARVEYKETMQHLNNFAAVTGQSGAKGKVSRESAAIWAQGLMGQGEVVAVGDSGLDVDSCYFRETKSGAPRLRGCDMTRKKVVCYYQGEEATFGDEGTSADGGGHGTHVAGTIAGFHTRALHGESDRANISFDDLLNSADYPNGMAPLARLAISDINGRGEGSVLPPSDLSAAPFFVDPYEQAGVRLHSNSWGCARPEGLDRQCNKYDAQTRSMDEFMWRNKDFLVLVAAGNSGSVVEVDTPISPAGAQDDRAGEATFADGFYTTGAPATLKNGISVGATRRNNRVPFECMFQGKECGTDDLFIASSRGPTFDGRIKPDVVFPGERTLSVESSGNPRDFSEGTCDAAGQRLGTRTLSGTSMSCPGVAGIAALVRQYYREFDPSTGSRASPLTGPLADSRGPSASLVKATVINSARPLTGYYEYMSASAGNKKMFARVSDHRAPRHLEGFGLPALNNTLAFSNTPSPTALHVFDRHSLSADGESHRFTFSLDSSAAFKATLVYTDAPGPVTGAFDPRPILINDLDLSATCSAGPCAALSSTSDATWSSESRVDNVEQLPAPLSSAATFSSPTRLTLTVSAVRIDQGPQPYALVVSGSGIALEGGQGANWVPDWSARAGRPVGLATVRAVDRRLVVGGVAAAVAITCVLALLSIWSRWKARRTGEPLSDGTPSACAHT
jgi:subtilisin family serine protease